MVEGKQSKVITIGFTAFTVSRHISYYTSRLFLYPAEAEVPTIASLKWQQSILHVCLHRNMFMFCGEAVDVWMEVENCSSPKKCESCVRTTETALAQNLVLLTGKWVGKTERGRFSSRFWLCMNTMFEQVKRKQGRICLSVSLVTHDWARFYFCIMQILKLFCLVDNNQK